MAVTLTRSRTELLQEALQNVGAASSVDSPSAEDTALADGKIDSMFLQLQADEVCDMPDTESIPGEWFADLLIILTQNLWPAFGGSKDTAEVLLAEARLRRRNAGRPTSERQLVEWF